MLLLAMLDLTVDQYRYRYPGRGGRPFPEQVSFGLAEARELLPVDFSLGGLSVCPSGLSSLQLPENLFPPSFVL